MTEYFSKNKLKELESKLDIKFSNKKLLLRALTHKSFANENSELQIKDNERLEFLGDSVLSLSISTYIFNKYDNYKEGKLAKIRSVIVSAPVLAEKALDLNLGRYLLLGKGEELSGGRSRDSILADTMEAILGAIYLDKGFDFSFEFIINNFKSFIFEVDNGNYIQDYKTMLQEVIQKNSNDRPEYEVVKEKGPDHNKEFYVVVNFEDTELGFGKGKSKKEAEQEAAKHALKQLDN
ncbi:MAG TPA: ribonuclease III [Halanaerobiales bacterium]|nr:ribonuclease III [Halanaerobiales bacterium]